MDDIILARRLEEARARAMQAGDLEALAPMLDPQLHYMHSYGVADSRDSWLAMLRDGGLTYHRLDLGVHKVVRRDPVLVVHGTMQAEATVAGERRQIHSKTTTVWARAPGNGAWRLLAFAPTPVT